VEKKMNDLSAISSKYSKQRKIAADLKAQSEKKEGEIIDLQAKLQK